MVYILPMISQVRNDIEYDIIVFSISCMISYKYQQLNQKHKYVDEIWRCSSDIYGFIAQQVKEAIPLAVELVKDTLPNIDKPAICSSNIITLEADVSDKLNIGDKIKYIMIQDKYTQSRKFAGTFSHFLGTYTWDI